MTDTKPHHMYRLIVADPPWPETGGGGRGTGAHYTTVPYDEIPALVLGSPAWRPERAFWFGCWTTKTSLPHAMGLLVAAGVKYVTAWTWIKESQQGNIRLGTGQYGRHGVEYLLWGKRGTIGRNGDAWKKARADFSSLLGKHSAKPDFTYEQALAVFGGPAMEMFARSNRDGYDVWGDDAGLVEEQTAISGSDLIHKIAREARAEEEDTEDRPGKTEPAQGGNQ